MSILPIIIKNEYLLSIRKKSFLVSTLLIPVMLGIIFFMQYFSQATAPTNDIDTTIINQNEITTVIISSSSFILWLFLLMFGGQIFNSVKFEKSNRIVEIILSSVSATKFMFAKIVAVGLIGLTQILIWGVMAIIFCVIIFNYTNSDIVLTDGFTNIIANNIQYFLFGLLSFIGGYIFYGALYAAMGALLDGDNENQTYMLVITMILLFSMYASMFIIENPNVWYADLITYLPFSSPIVMTTKIAQGIPAWQIIISYLILYASAGFSLIISGKIYTSGILMKGKRITLSNVITFIKS